jgi:hypothetical protein
VIGTPRASSYSESWAIERELHAKPRVAGFFPKIEDTIMRKVICTTMAGVMLFGLSACMVGCSDETGSKEEVKVTTPGGTTTRTDETKIKRSGDNPPPVPSDAKP